MNKTISLIIFIVIAAAVILGGAWYENSLSAQQSQQTGAGQAAAGQQTSSAQATSSSAEQSSPTSTSSQTMDNLKITELIVGTGTVAEDGDTVGVLYTGSLDDGTVFDASSKHGNVPFSFVLGAGQVIAGWDQGVVGMRVGGKRELVIPPALGYGASGAAGVIPPNATLHFTVELLSVATSSQ